jgi:hypothetical protein
MKLFCLIVLAVVVQAQSHAEDVSSPFVPTNAVVITSDFIARLMDEAQTNNPGFLAADSRAKAAAANVSSIRVWDDPMFMIGETVFGALGLGLIPSIRPPNAIAQASFQWNYTTWLDFVAIFLSGWLVWIHLKNRKQGM